MPPPRDETSPVQSQTALDRLDLLLCAAVPAELRAFGVLLGLEPSVGDCRIARHRGRTVGLLVAGIGRRGDGPLATSLRRRRPAAAVNVGVAGSLDPGLPAGSVVVVEGWHDPEPPHDPVARADAALSRRLGARLDGAGIPHLRAAALTFDEPLHDRERRDRLHAATGAAVVEMEGAAWARLAAAEAVPFAGLRVVSDHADRDLPEAAVRLMDRDRFLTPEGKPRGRLAIPGEAAASAADPPGADERPLARALRGAGRKWASANQALDAVARALLAEGPFPDQ